ncbi:hypothetical protein D9M71_377880 [compost metagenome]
MVIGALVDDLAIHDVDQAGIELEILRGQIHQGCHFPAGLAGFSAFQGAEAVFAAAYDARQLDQDAPALGRPHVAPGRMRVGGGLDGQFHVLRAAVGDLAQLLSAARVDLVDVLPRARLQGAAANVAFNFQHLRISSVHAPHCLQVHLWSRASSTEISSAFG